MDQDNSPTAHPIMNDAVPIIQEVDDEYNLRTSDCFTQKNQGKFKNESILSMDKV